MSGDSVLHRSAKSAGWRGVGIVVKSISSLVLVTVLARMLQVRTFGIYGVVSSIVALSSIFVDFGIDHAFLHHAPETEDEKQAAAVHFTLKTILILIWSLVMIAGTLLLTPDGSYRLALLVIVVTTGARHFTQTARLIVNRRIDHRKLAQIEIWNSVFTPIVSIGLAWGGFEMWALLSSNIVDAVFCFVVLHFWKPVWKPRLLWKPAVVKYYLGFGRHTLAATLLATALDRLDDLWTGFRLGNEAMGFYDRAYTLARYPSAIVAMPVDVVAIAAYAELKDKREQLSRVFHQFASYLIWFGFLLAGLLNATSSELIPVALGDKWRPMIPVFQLMLVFTILDPLKKIIAYLFIAVGRPEQLVRARLMQLVIMMSLIFLLGPVLGLIGVALAVDCMVVIGIVFMLWQARKYVDYSLVKLLAAPGLSLLIALLLTHGVGSLVNAGAVVLLAVKSGIYLITYSVIMVALDYRELRAFFSNLKAVFLGRIRTSGQKR